MVRTVLERVLHVKLDMAAVYAADATAAQDALAAAMSNDAASEETVRSGQLICLALGSALSVRGVLRSAQRERDANYGSQSQHVEDSEINIKQKSQRLIRVQTGRNGAQREPSAIGH